MLIDVALPLSLAIIMFSLGLGLTFADFGRVVTSPKPALTGIIAQLIILPIVAFLMLKLFGFAGVLAFGIMIMSFCPGGVTSNMLTKLGSGNVALSITLTAIVSLLTVLTLPFLVKWAADTFLGEAAPDINVTKIAISMFVITALPVLFGLLVRHFLGSVADKIEGIVSIIALILFVVIVALAVASNWALFVASFAELGLFFIVLNVILLALGVLIAKLMGIGGKNGISIAIELGVQNVTVGITVANLIAVSSGISEFAIPSAVYGITMYFVTIPLLYVLRRMFAEDA